VLHVIYDTDASMHQDMCVPLKHVHVYLNLYAEPEP